MTIEEAEKIFKEWQGYVEIADKLSQIFTVIPESFLPYPSEVLEEALNIVAKIHFDAGDKQSASDIQRTMVLWVGSCKKDEEALELIKQELDAIFKHPDLREAKLQNLSKSRNSWAEFKKLK